MATTAPPLFEYKSLDDLAVMVKVTPKDDGTFDAQIQPDPDKAKILEAIAEYIEKKPDLTTQPITKGGSSKGGKSRRNRKSKKARKGKSLRRK